MPKVVRESVDMVGEIVPNPTCVNKKRTYRHAIQAVLTHRLFAESSPSAPAAPAPPTLPPSFRLFRARLFLGTAVLAEDGGVVDVLVTRLLFGVL